MRRRTKLHASAMRLSLAMALGVGLCGCNAILGLDAVDARDAGADAPPDAPPDPPPDTGCVPLPSGYFDEDGDGVADHEDNCPQVANAGQENVLDSDELGDACDADNTSPQTIAAFFPFCKSEELEQFELAGEVTIAGGALAVSPLAAQARLRLGLVKAGMISLGMALAAQSDAVQILLAESPEITDVPYVLCRLTLATWAEAPSDRSWQQRAEWLDLAAQIDFLELNMMTTIRPQTLQLSLAAGDTFFCAPNRFLGGFTELTPTASAHRVGLNAAGAELTLTGEASLTSLLVVCNGEAPTCE